MIQAKIVQRHLQFKKPAGTSRGQLVQKPSWFIILRHSITQNTGIGECSIIPGLSIDPIAKIPYTLEQIADRINANDLPKIGLPLPHRDGENSNSNTENNNTEYNEFPAIQFALETAFADLVYETPLNPYPGHFSRHKQELAINGLIWMGTVADMRREIENKIELGYRCIKLKIGATDFESELNLIKSVRASFSPEDIEIRLDANGAFTPTTAMDKLERLSQYTIHSIEQPIAPGQWNHMALLCAQSPIPIALDEELIGVIDLGDQLQMLSFIRPQYIVLKPSLIGGIACATQWINVAEKNNIGWWATSALESNIGLNAIAQWVSHFDPIIPQGLGTGQLYVNNITSPLHISNGKLRVADTPWKLDF